ncbi:tissue factor-like [Anabas testudineus]|uniref:Tissue factor n=1 Tax=Anabas testudineus TaxID=64144 RepID=A0A3Q1ISF6_ANATE|nr:tissue factor-like [Anabas testudineus]
MVTLRQPAALCVVLCLCLCSVSGSYPKAQNVTWKSNNFKTFLTWEPEPSADYSYTVEYSVIGGNKQRNTHCIRSSAIRCDLTGSLSDLKANYTADVLSEPPQGAPSEPGEAVYSPSTRFCPYRDTNIGRPDFRLEASGDNRKITLHVVDPPTALFEGERQLNIRDIFADDLQYLVTYWKSKSTGKRVYKSKTSVIELTDLEKGKSYCFIVQAYIPSRTLDKQKGEESPIQCSADDNQSIFEVYSVGVIAAAFFLILLLIGIVIAIVVVCWKRRKNAQRNGREKVPQDV